MGITSVLLMCFSFDPLHHREWVEMVHHKMRLQEEGQGNVLTEVKRLLQNNKREEGNYGINGGRG